jgi:hypothetical protein
MPHALCILLNPLLSVALLMLVGCDQNPSPAERAARELPFKPLAERQPGIGLVIVLDVSGSMGERTRLSDGSQAAKLAVAKQVIEAIVMQTAQWAQRHPDEPIHLAVLTFADRVGLAAPMVRITAPGGPEQGKIIAAVNQVQANGSTAIGEAAIRASQLLASQNLATNHVLLVTDGENTAGRLPQAAAGQIAALPPDDRPAVYLIAFDVSEQKFANLRQYDWRVLPAADGAQLQRTIDEVVGGEILLEK